MKPRSEAPILLRLDTTKDSRPEVRQLLATIKRRLPRLKKLLANVSGHGEYEDRVYRYYHQSYKVFFMQTSTLAIVDELKALRPSRPLNARFLEILNEGTGKTFSTKDNERWSKATRPILEAFFHARFFLEMAVRYGQELKFPPVPLPSGWAALLYLYNLRFSADE